MTNQTAFSEEEWNMLGDAPLAACAAVAIAEPGSGAEREASAILVGWREAEALFPHSELLKQIIRSLDPQRREQELADAAPLPTYVALRAETIDLCRRAVALLRARATPQDLADYRQFVLHLVKLVADAAGERGLFGLGTSRVSPAEQAVVAEIEAALA